MLFTVNQVKNGVGVGWNSLKVDDLARKADVPTKTEFVELQNVVGDKLDKNPPHTHEMTQIKELNNTLDTKLDKNKKYNYSSILENPEAIDYLTTVETTSLEIAPSQNDKGYKFDVDSVGDLRIISNSQVISNYDAVNKKWIMGGIDVKDVLENHAAAINQALDGKVSADHTHVLKDITDYSGYDDTEVKNLIKEKADKEHTHEMSEITDYKKMMEQRVSLEIHIQ